MNKEKESFGVILLKKVNIILVIVGLIFMGLTCISHGCTSFVLYSLTSISENTDNISEALIEELRSLVNTNVLHWIFYLGFTLFIFIMVGIMLKNKKLR